jgi:hypothetical protein
MRRAFAVVWSAVRWLLAFAVLLTNISRSGRVGIGPLAAASWLLRKRRKR